MKTVYLDVIKNTDGTDAMYPNGEGGISDTPVTMGGMICHYVGAPKLSPSQSAQAWAVAVKVAEVVSGNVDLEDAEYDFLCDTIEASEVDSFPTLAVGQLWKALKDAK